jgi:hypothetical protein
MEEGYKKRIKKYGWEEGRSGRKDEKNAGKETKYGRMEEERN